MNFMREAAGALAGLLAGAVALGVSELTAAATGARGAPVVAVGETAINLTPIPVKEFAITHFGTHDKEALIVGILVILAGFAAVIGLLALRRLAFGLAGLAAFAAVGVAAAIRLPAASAADVVPTLAGAVVAMVSLWLLMRAIRMVWKASGGVVALSTGMDRRRLLIAGAGTAVVAAGAGGLGSLLLGRGGAAPGQVRLPAPALRAAPVPAGVDLRIPGLTPFVTPNASFYRVDTDLVLPQLSPDTWTLKIDGMVDRELEISFADLLRMPLTEADITMVCVSNQVGGTYNGNARWLGVPLAGLLRRAGVQAGADQVLSSATDGMTISTPVETIMDGRNALLAVGMNGQPLPVAHGFPARMI
ncbi:MAG TPA: molybdopterin-dependent oxidoreductase, partial [Streptosporangiaceae bacterium]